VNRRVPKHLIRENQYGVSSPSVVRFVVFLTQIIPIIFTVFGVYLAFNIGIGIMEVTLFLVMHIFAFIGIEPGLHRYFSHKSFKAKESLSVTLAIAGSTLVLGPVPYWVMHHRKHHSHSDTEKDPHSPKHGLFHAHMGWLYSKETVELSLNTARYYQIVDDIYRFSGSTRVIAAFNYYYLWILLSVLIPAIVGGLWMWSWLGFLQGMLWGGLIRIFVGQHTVWSVNSLCHTVGHKKMRTKDGSLNGPYFILLLLIGLSTVVYLCSPNNIRIPLTAVFSLTFLLSTWSGWWHNNHHAFPSSAYQQFYWWQIDPLGWFILLCEKLGLAYDLNIPSKKDIKKSLASNSDSH